MQAMILAAGFGTRLLPYSLERPKPLFPILNRPLLPVVIARLRNAGYTKIIVNCHHLREQIRDAVASLPGVIVQEEEEILGTGGGLRRALAHLDGGPLLITNGDIYHTVDFAELYGFHAGCGNEVTMVLHDCPRFNTVDRVGDRVVGFAARPGAASALAFTGVHVVNPEILAAIAPEEPSCIIDRYRSMLVENRRIACRVETDLYWTDIGTPSDYLALHKDMLTGAVPIWPEFEYNGREPILIHAEAECGDDCSCREWACVGRAVLEPGAEIRRSVVWDGALVPEDARVVDAIITPQVGVS